MTYSWQEGPEGRLWQLASEVPSLHQVCVGKAGTVIGSIPHFLSDVSSDNVFLGHTMLGWGDRGSDKAVTEESDKEGIEDSDKGVTESDKEVTEESDKRVLRE